MPPYAKKYRFFGVTYMWYNSSVERKTTKNRTTKNKGFFQMPKVWYNTIVKRKTTNQSYKKNINVVSCQDLFSQVLRYSLDLFCLSTLKNFRNSVLWKVNSSTVSFGYGPDSAEISKEALLHLVVVCGWLVPPWQYNEGQTCKI